MTDNRGKLTIIGITGIPEIQECGDLGSIIVDAVDKQDLRIERGDIIVVTHKVVSKAEGRVTSLSKITPSPLAHRIAVISNKDPRYVETVLQESKRIVRMRGSHLIVEHAIGHICANAGLDRSNVDPNKVVMLPSDPDRSAIKIRESIEKITQTKVAVIITDTCGRPFRKGQVNIAIGVSGLSPLRSYIGMQDRFGRRLKSTVIAVADELASAAELVMAKVSDIPVALIKGYKYKYNPIIGSSKMLIRDSEKDLFS